MRVWISTFGTHGDVVPYLALATRLRTAGHEVAVFTSASYAPQIEAAGAVPSVMSDEALTVTKALLHARTGRLALVKRMQAALRRSLDDEWQGARAFAPDVVVHHPKMLGSPHVAEKLGVPFVRALPLPFFTPTRAFPNPMFSPSLPRWLWRATYLLGRVADVAYAGMIDEFRERALGLARAGRLHDSLRTSDGALAPLLYAYSPALVPVPDDYPPHAHVTGFWFPPPSTWTPPAALRAFLDEGPPPVYVGFGSMGGAGGGERAQVVLDALALAKVRAVLARGWGGLATTAAPSSTVLVVDEVPHDWLFPRVAAVVHHGGAGTTAAGLRAGRPTLVCPFLADQPFWGRVVHERGAGPPPLPQRRWTVARLSASLVALTTNDGYRQRAEGLGAAIRAEDGVTRAVAVLEDIVARQQGRRSLSAAP